MSYHLMFFAIDIITRLPYNTPNISVITSIDNKQHGKNRNV